MNAQMNVQCYRCEKFGHYTAQCLDKPSAKAMDIDVDQDEQMVTLHSVQLNATKVQAE